MIPLGKMTVRYLPTPAARAGGFTKGLRPTLGPCAEFCPRDPFYTPDEKRAFRKRVAKRRAKKGYR